MPKISQKVDSFVDNCKGCKLEICTTLAIQFWNQSPNGFSENFLIVGMETKTWFTNLIGILLSVYVGPHFATLHSVLQRKVQGDTSRWFNPPVDIKTKVPFLPG